jgi:hypothetical protein
MTDSTFMVTVNIKMEEALAAGISFGEYAALLDAIGQSSADGPNIGQSGSGPRLAHQLFERLRFPPGRCKRNG